MQGERERRNPLTAGSSGPIKARVIAGNVTTEQNMGYHPQ